MVRLIKFGNKIKLLPLLGEEEETVTCGNCKEEFNASGKRRACFDLCGHVSCLECIFKMKDGCEECKLNGGDDNTSLIVEEDEIHEEDGIIVLSSVLGKRKENENAFPEIQRLSLSTLPVLECMAPTSVPQFLREEEVTPIVITLEDDDEEEEHGNVEDHLEEIDVVGLPEEHGGVGESLGEMEEDDDIQEVPVEEYTRLAGEEDWDVQSVSSHVTVIDPFQLSEDDGDNNSASCEPTPRNMRKRRFSQLSLVEVEEDEENEDDEEDDENLGNYAIILRNPRTRRISQLSLQLAEEEDEENSDNEEIEGSDFGRYICKECGSRFTKKLSLARHLAQYHSERRPFSCNLCGWPFQLKRNLQNHMLTHTNERPFKCHRCDGAYNRQFTLDNHLHKIHGIIVPKRGRGQRSKSSVQNESNENCSQEEAPASINQEDALNKPLSQSNGSTEGQPEVDNFEEEINHAAFQEEGPIPSPAFSVVSNDSEQKENKQAEHKGALLKRIYMKKKKVKGDQRKKNVRKCKQCKMVFDRKYCLDRHVKIAHLKEPRKEEFKTRKLVVGNSKKGRKNKKCNCKVCDLMFKSKVKLRAHSDGHLKLKCKICGVKKFERQLNLEKHLEKSHGIRVKWRGNIKEGERNGGKYCPECQSLFGGDQEENEEDDLSEKVWYAECGHLSCMDCVIKADGLGCGQCTTERVRMEDVLGRFFGEMGEKERRRILEVKVVLRRLEEAVVGNMQWRNLEEAVKCKEQVEIVENFKTITKSNGSRTFYCPYCKRDFREKILLGLHLQEMHKDKRPFACDICQWPFSSVKDLERHRIIHTNDKPFRCNLCPVTFNRKSTRDRHVEKVHLKWRRI